MYALCRHWRHYPTHWTNYILGIIKINRAHCVVITWRYYNDVFYWCTSITDSDCLMTHFYRRYYGLWLWFPEIFSRIEKNGGSACDNHNYVENATANMTVNTVSNFTNCVASTSNWIYLSGFLTALSNLPGNIFTIFLMDRIGGKVMLGNLSKSSIICVLILCMWHI